MFEYICSLFYEWDPVFLKEACVPEDEYSIEANIILTYLNDKITIEDLASSIYEVFNEQFNPNTMTLKISDCLSIANLILLEYKKRKANIQNRGTGDGYPC